MPIRDAARILGYCTRALYNMHAAGELALNKMRRRTLVPVTELERIKAKLDEAREPQSVGEPVREPVSRRPKKRRLVPLVK